MRRLFTFFQQQFTKIKKKYSKNSSLKEELDLDIQKQQQEEKYKINSKTKSKNCDVLLVYNYLLKNKNVDGDFWHFVGYREVQERLNDFSREDWDELKNDILNWDKFDKFILLNSITNDFYDSSESFFSENVFENAGNFLLDMFCLIDDFELRDEITYYSSFINMSKSKQIEKLEFMKNWILNNGYNTDEWINSKMNPVGNIETAIKNAIN